MPRKTLEVVPEVDDTPQPYDLEPVTDDLMSRLKVWGNCTQITINQLEADAPGWHAMISDVFNIVKVAIQDHTE